MKVHNVSAKFGSLGLRHGNHAFISQIAIFAPGFGAGELFQVFLDPRNDTDVCLFDIKEQGTRKGVLPIGDGIKCRLDAVNKGTLEFIRVLIQKTEAEDANRIRIGFQLLHDQIIVLTGFDVSAVLTDGVGGGFVFFLVCFFQCLDPGKLFGTAGLTSCQVL